MGVLQAAAAWVRQYVGIKKKKKEKSGHEATGEGNLRRGNAGGRGERGGKKGRHHHGLVARD